MFIFRESKELLKIVKGDYLNDLSNVKCEGEEDGCPVQQLPW